MARDRKDLGARKFVRIDLRKRGFLIPAPDAPWIECYILDISENGACLEGCRKIVRRKPGTGAGISDNRPTAHDYDAAGACLVVDREQRLDTGLRERICD